MRQRLCIGWLVLALCLASPACSRAAERASRDSQTSATHRGNPEAKTSDGEFSEPADDDSDQFHKSDREWRKILSPRQYRVTRHKETEEPGSGKYAHSKEPGIYHCVCCGAALFDSTTKFESGTGWPSFWKAADEKHVKTSLDTSAPELRVEVTCARCDAHLGHVFDDGPPPTGLRFCINSASLDLVAKGQQPRIGRKAETPRTKSKKARRKKPLAEPLEEIEGSASQAPSSEPSRQDGQDG